MGVFDYIPATEMRESVPEGRSTSQSNPRYRIACWIPVEAEEEELYDNLKEAQSELEHYRLLQPENIYKIEKVEDDEDHDVDGGREGRV